MKYSNKSDETKIECICCLGDEPLYWKDERNNVFVDSNGEVMATVVGKEIRFTVNYCPNCGRRFKDVKR